MHLQNILITGILCGLTFADRQYRSRPDLAPPRLNITIPAPASGLGNGYIFVCSYSGGIKGGGLDGPRTTRPLHLPRQWRSSMVEPRPSLPLGREHASNAVQRRVCTVCFPGLVGFYHGHGWGQGTLLGERYGPVRLLRGGNHHILDIHEFRVVEGKTALVEIYEPVIRDLERHGGSSEQEWIVDGIFQELDLDSGEVLFEWSSLDHINPSASVVPLPSGQAGDGTNSTSAWDYFHVNNVGKDAEGSYLISARHASAIYKTNGTTEAVIWQLGGRDSTFSVPTEAYPLNAEHKLGDECISLFDNSARADGHRGSVVEMLRDYSSAKVICLGHTNISASLISVLKSPDSLLAQSQGYVQRLENGNTFARWGQASAVTRFNEDGDAIFHAYLDSDEIGQGVQSYRTFRFERTGRPREVPAIVVLRDNAQDETQVRVRGGLDVKECPSILLGEAERPSFETSLTFSLRTGTGVDLDEGEPWLFAQALDTNGDHLVATQAVRVRTDKGALSALLVVGEDQDIIRVQ
ncbi:ASST-domain-containing protein [Aspergillus multicolor]|uniref:ASST-domain-containing protein n=1 Tax=Aspergillus multicolor TaxID=41759 RepID=UPI003CCC9884